MSRQKLLLFGLIGLVLLVIIIIVWIIATLQNPGNRFFGGLSGNDFGVIETNPPLDRNVEHGPTTRVEFTFNKEPHPGRINYSLNPSVPVTIYTDVGRKNTIGIVPTTFWQNGINVITLTTDTQAVDGTFLKENFTYVLNVKPLDDYELGVEVGAAEQALAKIIREKLPYDGTNFSIEYDAFQNIIKVFILESKKAEGTAELDEFLRTNGIENRSELLNLQINYV